MFREEYSAGEYLAMTEIMLNADTKRRKLTIASERGSSPWAGAPSEKIEMVYANSN
jgi:hypothetical protein